MITTLAITILMALYLGATSLFDIFLGAPAVVKLGMIWAIMLALCAAIVIIITLSSPVNPGTRPSALEIILWLAAFVMALFSVLTAAYAEMNVQIALMQVGPVPFDVTAPSRVESLLALALGLWPAAACLVSQQVIHRKRRQP